MKTTAMILALLLAVSVAAARPAEPEFAFVPARTCVQSDGTKAGTRVVEGSTTGSFRYVTHRGYVREDQATGYTVVVAELVIQRRYQAGHRIFLSPIRN